MTRPATTALSQERIVAAALRTLEREPTAGLGIRRVALELGVTPGALYNHIESLSALRDIVVDGVLAQGWRGDRDEEADPWERIRRYLLSLRAVVAATPGIEPLLVQNALRSRGARADRRWILGAFAEAGLDRSQATNAAEMLNTYWIGSCVLPPVPEAFTFGLDRMLDGLRKLGHTAAEDVDPA